MQQSQHASHGLSQSPERAPETVVWLGRTSQWVNLPYFLLGLLVVTLPVTLYQYLRVRTHTFTLTSERLRVATGVISRRYDDLELYRVKDFVLGRSLWERALGLGTLTLMTSDPTTPRVVLRAIPDPVRVLELFRGRVEALRLKRGVREMDVN